MPVLRVRYFSRMRQIPYGVMSGIKQGWATEDFGLCGKRDTGSEGDILRSLELGSDDV